jgi:2-amino-4-hydroxy-6-hydroxymethyldihydropteridine diphosphokinase
MLLNVRKVILGLGSNLGNRLSYINQAISQIGKFPKTKLHRSSLIYETEPWGNLNQGKFLNCCCEIGTDLTPIQLLEFCLELENEFGRVRNEVWGARTLDIDLLIFEGETSNESKLILPHPRIKERGFVLVPLFELYPSGNALGYEFLDSLNMVGENGIINTNLQ